MDTKTCGNADVQVLPMVAVEIMGVYGCPVHNEFNSAAVGLNTTPGVLLLATLATTEVRGTGFALHNLSLLDSRMNLRMRANIKLLVVPLHSLLDPAPSTVFKKDGHNQNDFKDLQIHER